MSTPQHRIDRLNEILHCGDIEFLRNDLAFGVARCIVEYEDPDLLNQFPLWVTELVQGMCNSYRTHGEYRMISNLGEADHSVMVGKLASLLPPRP
jgi:hypothetical protein